MECFKVNEILRGRPSADFVGMSFSKFNDARHNDPDFQACKVVPLGERAIGFFRSDLLKVLLRKSARNDGFEGEALDEEVQFRFVKRRAEEELIADAKAGLVTKMRSERRKVTRAATLARLEAAE
jgi:predicted DNA-binding transcriptional regulator AlpA